MFPLVTPPLPVDPSAAQTRAHLLGVEVFVCFASHEQCMVFHSSLSRCTAGNPKFADEKTFPLVTPPVPADPTAAQTRARLLMPADPDMEYSELKCAAALHPAQAFYLADLPEMYTSKVHQDRVNRVRSICVFSLSVCIGVGQLATHTTPLFDAEYFGLKFFALSSQSSSIASSLVNPSFRSTSKCSR